MVRSPLHYVNNKYKCYVRMNKTKLIFGCLINSIKLINIQTKTKIIKIIDLFHLGFIIVVDLILFLIQIPKKNIPDIELKSILRICDYVSCTCSTNSLPKSLCLEIKPSEIFSVFNTQKKQTPRGT